MSQHMDALAKANAVKRARTELRRRVEVGEFTVAEIIMETPPEAASMWVVDLLRWQRQWGLQRARRLLRTARVGEARALGSLTARERGVLVECLERL